MIKILFIWSFERGIKSPWPKKMGDDLICMLTKEIKGQLNKVKGKLNSQGLFLLLFAFDTFLNSLALIWRIKSKIAKDQGKILENKGKYRCGGIPLDFAWISLDDLFARIDYGLAIGSLLFLFRRGNRHKQKTRPRVYIRGGGPLNII